MPTTQAKHADHSIGTHFTTDRPAHWSQTAIGMWNPMSAALQLWNARYVATLAAFGLEWSSFLSRRIKEDVELPMRLAAAKSPEEIWNHYSAFWTKMAHDYRQELDALARLGNEHAQVSLDVLKSTVDTTVDARSARDARH